MDGVAAADYRHAFGSGVYGLLYAFGQSFNPVVLRLYAKGCGDIFQGIHSLLNRADDLRVRVGGRAVFAADESIIFCKKSVIFLHARSCVFLVNLIQ